MFNESPANNMFLVKIMNIEIQTPCCLFVFIDRMHLHMNVERFSDKCVFQVLYDIVFKS